MEKLLDAVSALVCQVSPEKIEAMASKVRRTELAKADVALRGIVTTPLAAGMVDLLVEAWRATTVGADELASMLRAASHVFEKTSSEQSTELVWTGPTTPCVSARRTEQALLQVIDSAQYALFLTSFVAYDVTTIVKALNSAIERGVAISMLLELSRDQGGSSKFDVISLMKALIPAGQFYAWRNKDQPFFDGCVHAKVAVADGLMCFITSANLTGHAMEKNMEAGVLISGGQIPRQLQEHLHSLIDMKIITRI